MPAKSLPCGTVIQNGFGYMEQSGQAHRDRFSQRGSAIQGRVALGGSGDSVRPTRLAPSSDYRNHTRDGNQTSEQGSTTQGTRSAIPKLNIYHGSWEKGLGGLGGVHHRNRSAMQREVIQGMGQTPSVHSRSNINKEGRLSCLSCRGRLLPFWSHDHSL